MGSHSALAGLLSGASEPLGSVVIALAAIAFLLYRQFVPRRLSGRSLLVVPVVLAYFLFQAMSSFHPSSTQVADIAVSTVVSLVFGLVAARQLWVYPDAATGQTMAGGSWTYFLWWLAAFVVKAALAVALGETSFRGLSGVDLLIPVFVLVATRNGYLYWRASRLGPALH